MNLNQGKRNKQAVQVLNKVEYDPEGNPIGMMEDPSNPASANFGTPREPRRGGCYKGDGAFTGEHPYVDMYNSVPVAQNFSVEFDIIYKSSGGFQNVLCYNFHRIGSDYYGFSMLFAVTGQLNIYVDSRTYGTGITLGEDEYSKIRIDVCESYTKVYKNDNLVIAYGAIPIDFDESKDLKTTIGRWWRDYGSNQQYYFNSKIWNVRINELDSTGNYVQTLAKYNCSENSGDICYDSSGNGHHGTIVNAITTTPEENPNSIHQYQDVYSFENEEGYSGLTVHTMDEVSDLAGNRQPHYFNIKNVALRDIRDFSNPNIFIPIGFGLKYRIYVECPNQYTVKHGGYSAGVVTIGETNRVITFTSYTTGQYALIDLRNINNEADFNNTYLTIELIDYNRCFPKDTSITLPPFKDVLDNNLQYVGKVPGKAKFVNSSCFKGDISAYLAISGLLTTDTIEVFGSSGTPTIPTNGELHVVAGDEVYGVKIFRSGVLWSYLPLCEPIVDPSNHTYHDVSGNGNHATLINGTLANNGKQDEFHYLQRGFEKISYLKGGGGEFGFGIPRQLYGYAVRVKPLSNTQTAGIIGGTGGFRVDDFGSGITMKSGRFRAQASFGGTGYLSAVYPYTIGVWYHLVVTFSEIAPQSTNPDNYVLGNARFYVNGELFDEQLNVQLFEYAYAVNVLTQWVNTPLDDSAECLVSDAALPNVELNPSEVKALYNREYSNLNLICLYEFKEVENSSSVYDSVGKTYTSLYDSTNGHRNFELVPKKQGISEGANGVALNHYQDSHSFLNTGTELEAYDYPALRQTDKNGGVWYDESEPQRKSFDSLTYGVHNNQYFVDNSDESNTILKNITTYHKPLVGRQVPTEEIVRNVRRLVGGIGDWIIGTTFEVQ